MKTKSLLLLVLLMGWASTTFAQETLTLEEAIKIALDNNFAIKLAKNELKISQTNNSYGNAGMLPSINATLTNSNSTLHTKQTQSNGTVQTVDGAKNSSLIYGIGLDWTLFDGLKMFAKKEQLQLLEQQGETQLKMTLLNKISDVYIAYYDLVQQQQQIKAQDTALQISQQRVTTAQNRFTIGKASKLEVLNSQVDWNADHSIQLKQLEQLATTKTHLNELLARDVQIDFQVSQEVTIDYTLSLDELKKLAAAQNPDLQNQIIAKNSAELQLKQVKAGRYPTVKFNSGYNFTHTEASLGFVTQSQGNGITYGVSAAVPIFNGFNQNRSEKVAKYQLDNATIAIQQQESIVMSQLTTAFQSYQTNLALVKIEESNTAIAKQNLDITLAKYKIGTLTSIDFRTAQLNYIEALVRYSNAQFQTKLYEISLKTLAGNLSM